MTYHRVWRPKPEPHNPPDYDDDVIMAVRSFAEGVANGQQQKLVWTWLMYVTAASDEFQDLSYRPGEMGTRATDFAEAKRFVGMQFRKMLRPELTPKLKTPEPKRQTLKDISRRRKKT